MQTIYEWQRGLKRASIFSFIFSVFVLYTLAFCITYIFFSMFLEDPLVLSTFFSVALLVILVFPLFYQTYRNPSYIVTKVLSARKPIMQDDLERKGVEIVEKMKIAFGFKNVETYIIPWNIINAMTVSTKDKAYIFITYGALRNLNEEELENVIAHEFSHIVNKDSYYMTLAVIVGGLSIILAYFILRIFPNLIYKDEKKKGMEIFLIVYFLGFILALITPIIQKKLIEKFSKEREFLADSQAVLVTKYPPGMINALIKVGLESTKKKFEELQVPKTLGAMFFDYEDFETHPPIWERIERLSKLTKTPVDQKILKKLKKLSRAK